MSASQWSGTPHGYASNVNPAQKAFECAVCKQHKPAGTPCVGHCNHNRAPLQTGLHNAAGAGWAQGGSQPAAIATVLPAGAVSLGALPNPASQQAMSATGFDGVTAPVTAAPAQSRAEQEAKYMQTAQSIGLPDTEAQRLLAISNFDLDKATENLMVAYVGVEGAAPVPRARRNPAADIIHFTPGGNLEVFESLLNDPVVLSPPRAETFVRRHIKPADGMWTQEAMEAARTVFAWRRSG
ncbi:hypothetical protein EMIHUDRAFT_196593 [Emiliania huxleyi CCMP1516]|uniref:UBA domain-containing protein n=2 Tax=Emiliania huxleyi TaxID=2903 RepID=A0A0D3J4E1_EMIH1|nr:hypothetical protein EMIHUDRAFT_196593 [Emiliania huxleyi CCMP1516]EOD18376.1 hypothetical protein EMIHUDRAFT_196593 [Emiliania huxleyi CCMP1516]|eukprot:XP_005770805.1 hypothetical protein EMIHUDRAFT_196593 [Emiliania huxleyi CCMP1516]